MTDFSKKDDIKLFQHGLALRAWQQSHGLSDDEMTLIALSHWGAPLRAAVLRENSAKAGKVGGAVKSPAKARSSAANGKLGGRPRKVKSS